MFVFLLLWFTRIEGLLNRDGPRINNFGLGSSFLEDDYEDDMPRATSFTNTRPNTRLNTGFSARRNIGSATMQSRDFGLLNQRQRSKEPRKHYFGTMKTASQNLKDLEDTIISSLPTDGSIGDGNPINDAADALLVRLLQAVRFCTGCDTRCPNALSSAAYEIGNLQESKQTSQMTALAKVIESGYKLTCPFVIAVNYVDRAMTVLTSDDKITLFKVVSVTAYLGKAVATIAPRIWISAKSGYSFLKASLTGRVIEEANNDLDDCGVDRSTLAALNFEGTNLDDIETYAVFGEKAAAAMDIIRKHGGSLEVLPENVRDRLRSFASEKVINAFITKIVDQSKLTAVKNALMQRHANNGGSSDVAYDTDDEDAFINAATARMKMVNQRATGNQIYDEEIASDTGSGYSDDEYFSDDHPNTHRKVIAHKKTPVKINLDEKPYSSALQGHPEIRASELYGSLPGDYTSKVEHAFALIDAESGAAEDPDKAYNSRNIALGNPQRRIIATTRVNRQQ